MVSLSTRVFCRCVDSLWSTNLSSLKTEENLAAAASIPSGRLMMETGRYVIMKVLEVKLAGCGFQQTKILFI